MRHGRLLGLLGVTSAAIWIAAAPAGAITLSLGPPGSGPVAPISLPLPVAVSVTPPNNGSPLGIAVNAPASTAVNVQVGPTNGLDVSATSGGAAPIDLKVAVPSPANAPSAPVDTRVSVTLPSLPAPATNPSSPLPISAPAPVSTAPAPPQLLAPPSGVATKPVTARHVASRAAIGTAIGRTLGDPASARSNAIADARSGSARRVTTTTASMTPTHSPGLLFALPEISANIALWLALAVCAIAVYWFMSSALAARRRVALTH